MSYLVLDVSKYNTISDYNAAAKEVDGVIIRIGFRGYGSSGTLSIDSLFETHYNGFKDTGIKIGYYWFTQAISDTEAIEEANYVHNLIKNKKCDFPIYIDSEYSNNNHDGRADSLNASQRTQYLNTFCSRIRELGYRPGVYASDSWYVTQLIWGEINTKGYSIWDAKYSTNPPSRITGYDGWQYTSSGTIAGCNGRVDLSYFYNDVAGWGSSSTSYNIEDCIISTDNIGEIVYWKGENKPVPVVKNNSGGTLSFGTDYTVSYADNINAGKASIVVRGIGNYSGTKTVHFTISPRDLSKHGSASCGEPDDKYCYDLNNLLVQSDCGDLVRDVDFVLEVKKELSKNTETGFAYYNTIFTVTGINNWTGSITSVAFNTRVYDVSLIEFTLNESSFIYTGAEIKPELSNKQFMTVDVDYTVTYNNNINKGTGSITLTGKGKYFGTKNIDFVINSKDISSLEDISLSKTSYVYTGKENTPSVESDFLNSIDSSNYRISYSNNINVGNNATVLIEGLSNCTGSRSITFSITPKDISKDAIISCGEPDENGCYELNYLKVEIGDTTLAVNKDYELSITTETTEISGVLRATVLITGIKNYTGSVTENYNIADETININTLNPTIKNEFTYTGQEITIEITYEGLELGKDYTLRNESGTNAGSYTVVITGIGKYSGAKEVELIIHPIEIGSDNITVDYGETDEFGCYDLSNYSISFNDRKLELNKDYSLNTLEEIDENYEYKICKGSIIGVGNYSGTVALESKPIEKCKFDIGDIEFTLTENVFEYTGKEIVPELLCTDDSLILNKHYTVTYEDNINVGIGKVIVTGKYGFANTTKEMTFIINAIDISNLNIRLNNNSFTYSGKPLEIEIVNPETEYEITYTISPYEKVLVGKYTIILTGNGNFTGTKSLEFRIEPKSFLSSDIVLSCGEPDENECYNIDNFQVLNNDVVLSENIDYEIMSVVVNKQPEEEYDVTVITVKGINNFVGDKLGQFNTSKVSVNIDTLNITLEKESYDYTGKEIKPKVIFDTGEDLKEGIDYEINYHNNINAGVAVVIITAKGDYYTGSKSIQFQINPYDLTLDCTIDCGEPDDDGYYNLDNLSVSITSSKVKLIKDVDYEQSCDKNINDDMVYSVISVLGKGNYRGTFSKSFLTEKLYKDISKENISLPEESFTYTGNPITFDLLTDLRKDVDYTAEFRDNINVGVASVIVTGKGDYNNSITLEFEILPKSIVNGVVSCGDPDLNGYYDLDNLLIIVDDKELTIDVDYSLSVKIEVLENLNTISHLTITGINNYTGELTEDYLTGKDYIDISNISFTIDKMEYDYTGFEIMPEVHSGLIENFGFKVQYKDNINAGVATIVITGIGNYRGNKEIKFKINMLDLENGGRLSCGEPNGHGVYDLDNLQVTYNEHIILVEGKDYKISINKIDSGEYTISKVIVEGINNYTGVLSDSYKTEKIFKDIRLHDFKLDQYSFVYTTAIQEHKPKVVCDTLSEYHYQVYYKDNINAGTAKVIIYGTRDYLGEVEIEFEIKPADISTKAHVTCGDPDENGCYDIMNAKVYLEYIDSGFMNVIEYELNVEEIEEDDFVTAVITATGIDNYTGSVSGTFNIRKVEDKDDGNNTTSPDHEPGQEVILDKVTVYPRYCSRKSNIIKSGTYYIWDNHIINNRIRITTKSYFSNVVGQIIGWIDLSALGAKPEFQIGDMVEVSGKLTKYADGSGNTINKINETMYIVDLLELTDEFVNNIGLASGPNNTRQGWASKDMIKK